MGLKQKNREGAGRIVRNMDLSIYLNGTIQRQEKILIIQSLILNCGQGKYIGLKEVKSLQSNL